VVDIEHQYRVLVGCVIEADAFLFCAVVLGIVLVAALVVIGLVFAVQFFRAEQKKGKLDPHERGGDLGSRGLNRRSVNVKRKLGWKPETGL